MEFIMRMRSLQNFLTTLDGNQIFFCVEHCDKCSYHNNCKLESILKKSNKELDTYLDKYLNCLVQLYYERYHNTVNYTWETSKSNITCKQQQSSIDPSFALAIGQDQCKKIREIRNQYLAPTD